MKKLLVILSFFVFATVHAEPADIGTYAAYKDAVKNYCEDTKMPWNVAGVKNPLIKFNSITYPDIASPESDKQFEALLDTTKGDKEDFRKIEALQAEVMPIAGEIEKSSAVYKERMNSIYACAVLNAKYRIHFKLLETFRPSGSNIVRKLEQTSAQIVKLMTEKQCRNVSKDGEELSLKREIIAQTTAEYCNYRHYLYYVDYSVKHRLGDIIALEEKKRKANGVNASENGRFQTSEALASELANVATRIDAEIVKTQGVYGVAFDAYADFERNYASHVIMVMIEDRYAMLRDFLGEAMNPIGQVIYLASNATSKGK